MPALHSRAVVGFCVLWFAAALLAADQDNPLLLPEVGSAQLRVLTPTMLELTLVTTKTANSTRAGQWDFADSQGHLRLPGVDKFQVTAGGQPVSVKTVGFRRRVVYAPLAKRDLRIGNYLYLGLAAPIPEGQAIEVKNPDAKLWPAKTHFTATLDPLRYSPAIHVNQHGYVPGFKKQA